MRATSEPPRPVSEQHEQHDDQHDKAKASADPAAGAPPSVTVVTAAATENQDQENQQKKHADVFDSDYRFEPAFSAAASPPGATRFAFASIFAFVFALILPAFTPRPESRFAAIA